jgi:hypothetical protein
VTAPLSQRKPIPLPADDELTALFVALLVHDYRRGSRIPETHTQPVTKTSKRHGAGLFVPAADQPIMAPARVATA